MGIFNYISIAGIISFVIAFFNKEHDKYIKNREIYFDVFLVKFYDSYRRNPNFNMKKFYNKSFSYHDIYIPPYINYLLDNRKYDELKKVLLIDYYELFPSVNNVFKQAILNLINVIDFIYYLIIFLTLMILLAIMVLLFGVMGIIYKSINVYDISLLVLSLSIVTIILKSVLKYLKTNDIYTYNRKDITKIINKKIEKFKTISDNLYFLEK